MQPFDLVSSTQRVLACRSRWASALALLLVLLLGLPVLAAPEQQSEDYKVYLPLVQGGSATQLPPVLSPLSISVTPDGARTATAEIGSEGGMLSATGGDGTTYTLMIPPGALVFTETLTLTPAASLAGLPLSGGALGALQIAPEGLFLLEPATLMIVANAAVADGMETYGFAFDGAGAEFHLRASEEALASQRATMGGKIITIRPQRLRGYGAGKGTKADVEHYRQRHRPSRSADQMAEDDLVVSLERTRDETITNLVERHAEISDLLRRSASDPDRLDLAVETYTEWLRQVEANGLKPSFGTLIDLFRERLREAVRNASRAAHARCVAERRPSEGLNMQAWLRYVIRYALPADMSEVEARIAKCLNFELEMTAAFKHSLSNYLIASDVSAKIPLRPNSNQFLIVGTAPLVVRTMTASSTQTQCTSSWTTLSVWPVKVTNLALLPTSDRSRLGNVGLYIRPGGIPGRIWHACPKVPPIYSEYQGSIAPFMAMHVDEMLVSGSETEAAEFSIYNWQLSEGAELLATKVYTRSRPFDEGNLIEEQTTLNIYHRPLS